MVTCEHGRFLLDGKPFFLYSGEIHYFRLAPERWPTHLRAARAAGLNTVSSYIPWLWHEPEEEHFDFTGRTHPRRDLVRFLGLVEEHGLRFLARVGPVSNAELLNEGIPQWLIDGHPEIFVRGREITNLPHSTLLAYLNPTFQKYAGRWYDQVLPLVRERQHPRGPVILVQLDNEVGMVQWLQKAADYGPDTERRYREFLRARYAGNLGALNRAYGAEHRDFAELAQPASGTAERPGPRLWDWMAFYHAYYAEYFATLHARYAHHGLRAPVLANIPQFYDFDVRGRGVFAPMTTMMFRDFAARVPQTVFGGAYQTRRLDYENCHDIPVTTEVVKLVTAPGLPAVCAELQTGIMRDRPRLYPADVELNLKSSAAHGLNGLNAYMFSGGCNAPGMGAFGSWHEWQAPVAPDGSRRPHYAALRDFGRQLRAFGPRLAETEKRCDVAVGFYAPYWTTEYLGGPAVERWEWQKHHLFYDGLARLLQLANLNFSLVDLERAAPEELRRRPALFVFALEFMDAATQAKLADYVRGGGRLLVNPDLPVEDLGGAACTVLADALGVRVTGRRTRGLGYAIGKRDYLAQGSITELDPGASEVTARTLDGVPCGLRAALGAGEALLLGFGLSHVFDYQVDLVRDCARQLGVAPAVAADGGLQVCLRANERFGFLFVANFHDLPAPGRLRLVLPGETRPTALPARGRLRLERRRGYLLPLNLPLAGGDVLRYTTAELLDAGRRGGALALTVTGAAGAAAEVELLTAARGARLDGRRVAARRVGGRLRLGFALSGEPQTLVVR